MNLIKLIASIVLAVFLFSTVNSQDISVPKNHLNNLASHAMQGRGYVNHGDRMAADYIRKCFYKYGVQPLSKRYFQNYSFPINTFPGEMQVQLDSQLLKPVYDYVLAPESKGRKGTFELHYLPEAADTIDAIFDSIIQIDYSGKYVVANFKKRNIRKSNPFKASGVVLPQKSVFWWASTGYYESENTFIMLSDSLMLRKPQNINVNFENKFRTNYKTQNVAGVIKGVKEPDSLIVFTAHYDHLGWMGKGNVFLGANDNASGTAMLLWLAEYFTKPEYKPDCSVAFLLFSGEESGLHGSRYFTENPLFELSKVKALINLDMVGSGSDGIALVNGKANPKIASAIETINREHNYFSRIKIRGESCSSDHCFFHKKGVPAVFIYTMGDECKDYHNLNDVVKNTPLTKFWELREMLIAFTESF